MRSSQKELEIKNEEWRNEKLKDIILIKSGATPRRSTEIYWENGNILWLKPGELNNDKNFTKTPEFITQQGLDNSSAKLFPKGILLMVMYRATAGKLGILEWKLALQAVCSIQNNKDLFVEEYLYYYLLMIREQIILDSFGGAQPNISKKDIDDLQVPLA